MHAPLQLLKESVRGAVLSRRYPTAIFHYAAKASPSCSFEDHVVLLERAQVIASSIGRYTYVGEGSVIRSATVGRYCSIGPQVWVGLGQHPTHFAGTSLLFYRCKTPFEGFAKKDLPVIEHDSVVVGDDVWIGARAMLMGGIKVGNGAIIGAGAVVTKDVPSYGIVGGVPARLIRFRFTEDLVARLEAIAWWERDAALLRRYCDKFSSPEALIAALAAEDERK